MNEVLKSALAEKSNKRAAKTRIVQTRMEEALHAEGARILRKRGLAYGEYFRAATRKLIADERRKSGDKNRPKQKR